VKPQNHVLSADRCDACHTSVTWKPASHFDHHEVQGSCATCHNGVNATGKSFNHVASTMECEACHSVFGWKQVIRVDHTQVNGTCATCHPSTLAQWTCTSCHDQNKTANQHANVPDFSADCMKCHPTGKNN
jgi:hypothetical protein